MIDIRVRVTLDVADLEQMGGLLRALLGQATVTMHQVEEAEPELEAAEQATDDVAVLTTESVRPGKTANVKKGRPKRDDTAEGQRGKLLPYDEFDRLARAEMKRLSMDNRLPGRVLWDAERDKRLPTFEAVRSRFQCANVAELAEKMDLLPPIHAGRQRDGVTG